MFQKLEAVEKRYEELNVKIADPEVISNQNEWKKMMKEHSDLTEVVAKYREYKKVKQNIEDAEISMEFAGQEELENLEDKNAHRRTSIAQMEEQIKEHRARKKY